MLILRLYTDSYLPMYPGSGKKVCLVVVVCKPILVFYFGPNQALGLELRLGPSRTIRGSRFLTKGQQDGTLFVLFLYSLFLLNIISTSEINPYFRSSCCVIMKICNLFIILVQHLQFGNQRSVILFTI